MAGSRLGGEVAAGDVGRGRRAAGLVILWPARSQRGETILDACCMQLRCCGPRGGGLGGALLGLAQLSDRGGQGCQVRDQRGRGERGVAGDLAGHGQQPGSGAQLGALSGGRRGPAVSRAGGAVVAVRGPAKRRVPQSACRGVQGVRRCHLLDG